MERESQNEYVLPPSSNQNMYESLREYEYDYIQRSQLPLPKSRTETSLWYDTAYDPTCDETEPKQCDSTEVKQVVDSESAQTLNHETGCTIMNRERICWQRERFVHGESLQPTDDDHGPHVWEPQCYPSGNQDIHRDTEKLVQRFNNSSDSDRETLAITITSCVIPQYYKENNTTGLAKLFHCKCNKIQTLALNRIAGVLFRHRISSCPGYQLLGCADVVWGALKNNRNRLFIRHLSYVMVLLLSTVYLWGISNPEKWDKEASNVKTSLKRYISEFPDQRMYSCLDESSKSLLWALKCFIHCLEANSLHSSILQIGEWEQCLLLKENRSMIERKVDEMAYSELMALSVLLLNLLNRVLDSTDHISSLLEKCLTHLLKSTKCKLCGLNRKQKLTGKSVKSHQQHRGHLSANVVATGLIRAIQTIDYKKETYTIMKNIIVRCVDESLLTKQMLMIEIEKLCFSKHYCMRLCGVELLGVACSNVDICRGYIARSLSLPRLSLSEDVIHKSADVGHPFWIAILGNFGDIPVKLNCLVPTKHCVLTLFSEDYKINSDRDQTADNWNTFETLKILQCSGGHSNIVKLLAYQYFPLPFFFILENQPKRNFLEWLLSRRNENSWMTSENLIFMIKDAVSAVRFMHANGILHRDLTACRCVISDESYSVKLHEFRLAKKGNVIGDESRLATRWMAPESMRYGKFSQQTDIWMMGLFIWEVLTLGCWPFTEHSDKPTDVIMELVVYRHLKPAQFPCISDKLYQLILRCLDDDPNSRITLKELEEKLGSIIQAETPLSPGMKGVITPLGRERQRRYPYLLNAQKDRCQNGNFEPEMGIPRCLSQKPTVSYVNLRASRRTPKTVLLISEQDLVSDDQPQIQWRAMVHVSEPLLCGAVPYIDDLKSISEALKLEVKIETNGDKIMKYTYPNGDTLLNLVLRRAYDSNIDSYIEILLNIAKCVERFHRHGWIVRCITARDICVTGDKKICFLRLGRTAPLADPKEDWLFGDVFMDRLNWLPLEVIRDKTYSRKSDVYMVAMTAYEMFSALDLHFTRPVRNELGCIPFAVMSRCMIEDALSRDEVPERPNSCPEWLYKILRRCWHREKINRLTITELIAQIEEKWPSLLKMHDEKDTQVSNSNDQEDLEAPPELPPRTKIIPQKALFRSFGDRMSLAPLPLPCISSDDNGERISALLEVSDFDQFMLRRIYSSSDNYPDETDSSDELPIERRITRFRSADNNGLQLIDYSSSSTDQQFFDRKSLVRMRTKRGRRQRRHELPVKHHSAIEKHSLIQNDMQGLERLEINSQFLFRNQLMDISSSSKSSQEDVAIDFENESESDTPASTLTTNRSQSIRSRDNILIYNRTPSLSTISNSEFRSVNQPCVKECNENNYRNSPTKKSKVPVDKTTSGNCVKTTHKSSIMPKLTFQNTITDNESSSKDSDTIHSNSDLSGSVAQNCTSGAESACEMGTHHQTYRSERMQTNMARGWSMYDKNHGYLTVY